MRLRPEMLPSLRLRRASDHAELPRSQECLDRLSPAQETDVQDGLRLVA